MIGAKGLKYINHEKMEKKRGAKCAKLQMIGCK